MVTRSVEPSALRLPIQMAIWPVALTSVSCATRMTAEGWPSSFVRTRIRPPVISTPPGSITTDWICCCSVSGVSAPATCARSACAASVRPGSQTRASASTRHAKGEPSTSTSARRDPRMSRSTASEGCAITEITGPSCFTRIRSRQVTSATVRTHLPSTSRQPSRTAFF
ncbi:MAG: hypothetical protein QM770_02565 [Tepidisphaeraceae bacterium]